MKKVFTKNPNKGNTARIKVPLYKKVNSKLRDGTLNAVTFTRPDKKIIRQSITDNFVRKANGQFRHGKDIVRDIRAIQHDLGANSFHI